MWKAEIDAGVYDDGKYNVYGASPKGGAGLDQKLCLDPVIIILL